MADVSPPVPSWRTVLAPRWIAWHLFAVVAVIGMLWLGDWQFRRAMAGNALSWAYTFEWPIFAVFGVVFWVKTIRDELHPAPDAQARAQPLVLPAGTDTAGNGQASDSGQVGSGTQPEDGGNTHAVAPRSDATKVEDSELAEYNAYLAKLASQVKGHGRWHGLR